MTGGMKKPYQCRFCKKKSYSSEHYRKNHETNCEDSPIRGTRPNWGYDGQKFFLINEVVDK